MTEQQAEYITEAMELLNGEPAAEIHPPKTIKVLREAGLVEYKVWGWVKISANVCSHMKKLRGAKLSIWLSLAVNIDENGECQLTQKELCAMTGYSHTEVIDSVNELDKMGFLSVDRSGKKNLYKPVLASRGAGNDPAKEPLVKKLDSTPLDSVESSLAIQKAHSSIKELKELIPENNKPAFDEDLADIGWTLKSGKPVTKKQLYKRAELTAFEEGIEVELKRLRLNWIAFDEKAKDVFRRFIRDLPAGQSLNQFVSWWLQDEWRAANPPWTLAVIMQRWLQAFVQKTDERPGEYHPSIGV